MAQEGVSANMDKIAAANNITVADLSATINTNLAALLADSKVDNIDSSQDGVAITLTDTQAAVVANMAKLQVADTISVDATGASAAELTAINTAIAKVDSITNLTVTTVTQSDAETANLLGKASGAAVVATGASSVEIAALVTNIANIKALGISGTGLSVTDTQFAVLGSKLANGVTVSVDASSASTGEIAAMLTDVANIGALGITGTGLALTDTQFAALGSKLANAVTDVSVNATAATVGEIAAINADIANIGAITGLGTESINANGVTGALVLSGAASTNTVTVTNFSGTTLTGSGAKFNVTAGSGAQTIVAGAFDDTISGGAGADVITTGAGADNVIYATTNASTIGFLDIGAVTTLLAPGAGDTFTGTEVIKDFATGDTLTLGNTAAIADTNGTLVADEFMIIQGTYTGNVFTASADLNTGADSLLLWDDASAAGVTQSAAVLVGVTDAEATTAAASITLGVLGGFGAPAAYTLATGAESKTGTSGDDVFNGTDGAGGTFDGIGDTLDGGGGTDTLNLNIPGAANTSADADWTNISNFEKIAFTTTGSGAQTITTGAEFDGAFSGNIDLTAQTDNGAITIDMLASTKAATVTAISVTAGVQTITTGSGLATVTATTFNGGQTIVGDNLLSVTATDTAGAQSITSTGAGAVTVTAIAGNGAQTVTTAGGDDLVTLTTMADKLTTITTNAGNDTIVASLGTDLIVAGADADSIDGGAGIDTISAGTGTDSVDGGAGADIILGGADADVFVYRNHGDTAATWLTPYGGDTIADYADGAGHNTTALANAPVTGLNGDVLLFDYSDLAGLSGFTANTGFVVTANLPTGSNGTTGAGASTIAEGAGIIAANVAYAQFIYNSTDGVLRFDADGTAGVASPMVVGTLTLGLTLTATDFLFVA